MSSLVRKMMRHGKVLVSKGVTAPRTRDRAIKKGTPYRRLLLVDGHAVHATKGRSHDKAVLDFRMKEILRRVGAEI